ncbi:MAG: cation transporter [Leptospirales bacterium]
MSGCDCEIEIQNNQEKRVLIILLAINAAMFFIEFTFGWIAQSTGLIADSFDMFADAAVYAVSLYAVGRSLKTKSGAAFTSGILQLILGGGVFADVIRRSLTGSTPISLYMIGVGAIALVANTICVILISKHKHGEVHMRASWIFTKNDLLANAGVIISGYLVYRFRAPWPDLIIGALIASLVVHGGIRIVRDSLPGLRSSKNTILKQKT